MKSRQQAYLDGIRWGRDTPRPKSDLHEARGTAGMLDRDIRPLLVDAVRTHHPRATLFHEFPVRRIGRADVVAVNAAIWGYEIKSERDTLSRLPLQIKHYESTFDYCTVVAAERHLSGAERLAPPHWGIFAVRDCSIVELRRPQRNPNRRTTDIIRLLWKTECIKALRARGANVRWDASLLSIWRMLHKLPTADIDELVRDALKCRNAIESE